MRNEADSDCTPLGTPSASMLNADLVLVKPRSRSVAPCKNGQPAANTSHCTAAAPFSGCLLCHQPSITNFAAANTSSNTPKASHLFCFVIAPSIVVHCKARIITPRCRAGSLKARPCALPLFRLL